MSSQYLKTQVMTASPEMLQLMLWDGAIRFAEQGKDAIVRKDIEGSYKALLRAQRIVMELNTSLRHNVNPELCGKMSALYNFMYRRLVEANVQKEVRLVDEALEIMRHQRETWSMLMSQLARDRAAEAGPTLEENAAATDAAEAIPAATASLADAPRANPVRLSGYPAVRPTPVRKPSFSVQV